MRAQLELKEPDFLERIYEQIEITMHYKTIVPQTANI